MPAQSHTMLYLQYLCLTAVFGCLVSCSEPQNPDRHSEQASTASEESQLKELVRGSYDEPTSLDPQIGMGNEIYIHRDLFEGLVSVDADGDRMPAAAERWETRDGLTYTFFLRRDGRWSNGDLVTAQDFVFSWRRLASPATGTGCSDFLTDAGIENAADILRGKKLSEVLGVEAVNEHTLLVTLERENALFLDMLSRTCSMLLHQPTLEHFAETWTRPGNFIGNGAFILEKWIVNERIELVSNPLYHDAVNVDLERVVYLPISPAQNELNRYLAGEIDMTIDVPDDQLERLQRDLPNELHISPALVTAGWSINTERPPFDSAELRRALSYAIDREMIANKVVGLKARPAYSLSPIGDIGSRGQEALWQQWSKKKRETKARELYEKAGYGPDNPLHIKLQVLNGGNSPRLAIATAAMWKRVLGIEVTLIRYDWKTLAEKLQLGDFHISIYVYEAHYSDPAAFLRSQLSHTSDPANYKNVEFDSLIQAAQGEKNISDRYELYIRAEQLLADEVPFIPLLHGNSVQMVKPHVLGYRPNALTYQYSKDLSISANDS